MGSSSERTSRKEEAPPAAHVPVTRITSTPPARVFQAGGRGRGSGRGVLRPGAGAAVASGRRAARTRSPAVRTTIIASDRREADRSTR